MASVHLACSAATDEPTADGEAASSIAIAPSLGALAAAVPDTPNGLGVAGLEGRAVMAWTPVSNPTVKSYTIRFRPDGAPTWTTRTGVTTPERYGVNGLTNKTLYDFQVAAVNGAGASPWSETQTAWVSVEDPNADKFTRESYWPNCDYSHSLKDDPIVFPKAPGASHMHDFFGNTTTDAFSTVASLSQGKTNCNQTSDLSGYWVPALYQHSQDDGADPVEIPIHGVTPYYVLDNAKQGSIEPFPRGLKILAGDSKATRPQDPQIFSWGCINTGDGTFTEPPTCPTRLRVRVQFPNCWDGVHLDSPDHKSHMAYTDDNGVCDPQHKVHVPKIILDVSYESQGGKNLYLASGGIYSGHADYFDVWGDNAAKMYVTECINGGHRCQARVPGREELTSVVPPGG